MERFRYKDGCDICECTYIETFKKLAWAIDKRLRLNISTMLVETVIPLRIERMKPFLI